MKYYKCAFIIGLMILLICMAGCTSSVPSIQPPENKLSMIEPSDMALQLSDIPGNFTLKERSERVGSDVSQWGRDHGWIEGYYTIFQKVDLSQSSGTVIEQRISVYPIENISMVLPYIHNDFKNLTDVTVDELLKPNIGDSARAFRLTNKTDNTKIYVIAFVNKDIYENLVMGGTVTDYESLKQLATIAAAKIK